jgi:hypothetical protein
MKTIAGAFLTIGLLAAALPMAAAQPLSGPLNYNVKNMTFDLWCLETQRYAPERCQAARPPTSRRSRIIAPRSNATN